MQIGLTSYSLGNSLPVLPKQVAAILRKFGSDAHLYLPGVGRIDGFTTGNYLESTGQTNASVDGAVGLVLDAAGSVGAELVAGNGSTISGWTFANATGAIVNGELVVTATGTGTATATYLASHPHPSSYRYSVFVSQTSRGLDPYCAGASTGAWTTVGTKTGHVNSGNATEALVVFMPGSLVGETFKLSAVSVKEITGTHATQATTANKPTLWRGIVNLLLQNNDLNNVTYWRTDGVTTSQDGTTLPDGTVMTKVTMPSVAPGNRVTRNLPSLPAQTYTIAAYVKAGSTTKAEINLDFASPNTNQTFDLANPNGNPNASVVSVGGGVYLVAVQSVQTSTFSGQFQCGFFNVAGKQAGDSMYFGKCGLFAGAYTAAQILDAGGIPLTTTAPASSSAGKYAWSFDGVDDRLNIDQQINLAGSEYTFIACIKPAIIPSSTPILALAGSEQNPNTNPHIAVRANGVLSFAQFSNDLNSNSGAIAANETAVISGVRKATGRALRKNGVQIASDSNTQLLTSSAGLAIGSYWNGVIYAVLILKGVPTDTDLKAIEKWIGGLAGVQIP